MEASASFGSARVFKLTGAILLYSDARNVLGATRHDIRMVNDQPELAPGSPVTLAAVEQLARALGQRIESCLLPERVLALSMNALIWWCPAARRRIWFKPTDATNEAKQLKKLNGKFVHHPALLFALQRGQLTVLALGRSQRPTASTPLYRAPYFNLSPEGHLCKGTAHVPDTLNPADITRYENAFFDSAFSHSNWGHKLTRHPGGHAAYWQDATAAAPAVALLHRAKLNVGQLIHSLNK